MYRKPNISSEVSAQAAGDEARMQHFSDQAWADLVRGISPPEWTQMESHLTRHCAECGAVYDMWKLVQASALNESSYCVPESTIRLSKLMFAGSVQNKDSLAAVLAFDSFLQPAFAGIRSASAAARQMVYEVDGLAIDLRFSQSATSKKMQITGQILDKRVPRASLYDAEVIVWTDSGLPLDQTRTNHFGEFSLELEPKTNLLLELKVAQRAHFHIALANLSPDKFSPDEEIQD